MQSCQPGGGVHWCRAAVLLLTLCLTNKCGSAITFEEFVGYDVVKMVSMEENPAYVDVHITKKRENDYSPNVLSAI